MKSKKEGIKKLKKEKMDLMLFLLFCFLTLTFTIGYSALNTELKISGEAVYRVQADIRITDVSFSEGTYANENYNSKYSKDQVNLGVTLTSLDSSIKYKVTVTNIGNVNKIISEPEFVSNNENITYEFVPVEGTSKLIASGTTKEFYIIIKYKAGITLPENKTADISIKLIFDNESILAQGNSSSSSSTFFNSGPITKAQVETITFSSTKKVGDKAIGSWDASYNKDNSVIAWYTDNDNNGLYELTISGNEIIYLPQNSGRLFYSFNNLISIDFTNTNTMNVTDMSWMFFGCSSLTSLDLTSFNTSNVMNMSDMFFMCEKIANINLSSFNTSNVTDMSEMFAACSNLKILNLSNFDTSNVENMGGMFYNSLNIESLNVSYFNTIKVTNMSYMFYNCSNLTSINFGVRIFKTDSVKFMQNMFYNCKNLNSLELICFNTKSVVNMSEMFMYCSKLTKISLSNKFNTSNVTDTSSMFNGCSSLTSLDLSNFVTSNVTNMSRMFASCRSLTSLDLSSFVTSNVTNMSRMFESCSSLTSLDLSNFDTSNVTDMTYMFSSCYGLKIINLSSFTNKIVDYSEAITKTTRMFSSCTNLSELHLEKWDFNSENNDALDISGIPASATVYVSQDQTYSFMAFLTPEFTVIGV